MHHPGASAERQGVATGDAERRLVIRDLGYRDYESVWRAMRGFSEARGPDDDDELWLLEHQSVFTLGQAGRPEHVLARNDIPVLQSDRGGQVTYHGPGQLVAYVLVDLKRRSLGVRGLVEGLEQCVIDMLETEGIVAVRQRGAPGVYVDGCKVAALGLRVRHGRCYHGLSLNVDMDLAPFSSINPCGFPGLRVTRLADFGLPWKVGQAAQAWVAQFVRLFQYVPAPVKREPEA